MNQILTPHMILSGAVSLQKRAKMKEKLMRTSHPQIIRMPATSQSTPRQSTMPYRCFHETQRHVVSRNPRECQRISRSEKVTDGYRKWSYNFLHGACSNIIEVLYVGHAVSYHVLGTWRSRRHWRLYRLCLSSLGLAVSIRAGRPGDAVRRRYLCHMYIIVTTSV